MCSAEPPTIERTARGLPPWAVCLFAGLLHNPEAEVHEWPGLAGERPSSLIAPCLPVDATGTHVFARYRSVHRNTRRESWIRTLFSRRVTVRSRLPAA